MPIKNYTTTKGVDYHLGRLQKALIQNGAAGIQLMFDGQGRISGVAFMLNMPEGRKITFQLPCEWKRFQQVLKDQNIKRWDDDDYAYRVAWANLADWVEAQMTLYETQMVTMPQIFLPFAEASDGQTLFEKILQKPEFLLGGGYENNTQSNRGGSG